MELSSPTNTSSATIKNEGENETPTQIQQPKPLSFTNGVLKRRHHHFHHHHAVVVTYKECLKNHAAAMGGHAIDGCGEFMFSSNTNPNDPTSLKCAACGCHRNFHRRDPEDSFPPPPPPSTTVPALEYHPHHRHHPPPPPPPLDPNSGDHSSPSSPSPPPISSSYYPPPPHILLSLPGGGASFHRGGGGFSGGPPTENHKNSSISAGFTTQDSNPNSRKRFRTKFAQDQKEKMVEFAEKVGWKFQKRDEELIIQTCNEIGIDKGVLKVWMHNNKHTLGKKDHNFINIAPITPSENAKSNGNGNGFGGTEYHHRQDGGDTANSNNGGRNFNQLHQLLGNTNVVAPTTIANGSSSS